MSVSPRARADLATRNSQLAGVAPMKNGARFGATSQPDPTDATHGRLKDSDLARCFKRREMALWAPDKKRQFSPFLSQGGPSRSTNDEGIPGRPARDPGGGYSISRWASPPRRSL